MSYDVMTDGAVCWKVVRGDGKTMLRHACVKTCMRWVKTWGDVDLGR